MRSSTGCPGRSPGVLEGSKRKRSFWGPRVASATATEALVPCEGTSVPRGHSPALSFPWTTGPESGSVTESSSLSVWGARERSPRQAVPGRPGHPTCASGTGTPPTWLSTHLHIPGDVEGVKGQDERPAAQLGARLVSLRGCPTTDEGLKQHKRTVSQQDSPRARTQVWPRTAPCRRQGRVCSRPLPSESGGPWAGLPSIHSIPCPHLHLSASALLFS